MSASPSRVSERDLVLVVDVGNTNIVLGVFAGEELRHHFRLSSDERTADELAAVVLPLLHRVGVEPDAMRAVVVSSVVPPLHFELRDLCRRYFGRDPLFVEPGIKTGLAMSFENPGEVGADRVVNAVAAREIYGAPVVVVDFGTATTFDVVDEGGRYDGGIIAPGVGISAEALFSRASRLYRVDIRRPQQVIGRTTVGAMQSGIYYGYIGLVDGILARLRREIPSLERVVATGGLAEMVARDSEHITDVHPHLTLHGLKLIHDRNR